MMLRVLLIHPRSGLLSFVVILELVILGYVLFHKPPLPRWMFIMQCVVGVMAFLISGLFVANVRL